MESLVQLFNNWEIQLLVLFSFTLQIFLFFTGGLRRCTTSKFLRFLTWIAYLGADFVAVYALGFLSRLEDTTIGRDTLETHQLTFFWAPFFLIHLGGQDTITAFAIEDNNLWLRHLFNLVVQITLVLYVLWKSTADLKMQLLIPSIFVFIAGIVKYGERTWALKCASLKTLARSSVPKYVEQLPVESGVLSSDIVSIALHSIRGVRDVFADFPMYHHSLYFPERYRDRPVLSSKLMDIELGLMYDDLYTKAMVLRTTSAAILRCMSHISIVVAFVLFVVSNKQRYNPVDIAITYALFVGGYSLEVCATFVTTASPWTWAWLEARKCHGLSRLVLSIYVGWRQKRNLWSNFMGQYDMLNYLGQYDDQQSSLWKRRGMAVIRKVVNKVCGIKQQLWISKLLAIKFVEVDEEIMRCFIQRVERLKSGRLSRGPGMLQEWPNIGPVLERLLWGFSQGFEGVIADFYLYTKVQLSRNPPTGVDAESAGGVMNDECRKLAKVCQKLANYMLYLLATNPSMLPAKGSEGTLAEFLEWLTAPGSSPTEAAIATLRRQGIPDVGPCCTEAALLEIKEVWIRLLIYAAGKSRAEMHAAQLARGGELITFAWLAMVHNLLGDAGERVEIDDIIPGIRYTKGTTAYLYDFGSHNVN